MKIDNQTAMQFMKFKMLMFIALKDIEATLPTGEVSLNYEQRGQILIDINTIIRKVKQDIVKASNNKQLTK